MSSFGKRLVHWAKEAKRRRVYTSVIAYVIVAVTIIELGDAIFTALDLPDWSSRLVTILLMLGFPVVVVMAWVFDVSAPGVHKTSAKDEASEAGATETRTPRKARRVAATEIASPRTGRPSPATAEQEESEDAPPPRPRTPSGSSAQPSGTSVMS